MNDEALLRALDYLEKMITQQRKKVLQIARDLKPGLTPEDILNPQDYPELMGDPIYNFEDGILAGLISAQMSIRSEARRWSEEQQGN